MTYFLLAAVAVRLIGFNTTAIWFDEAVSKYRASLPLASYFTDMSDYTGANLWELILRPFAIGPVWLLRIPPMLASIAALWIAWRIMDQLAFTNAQRIGAAIPMILLPGLIWQAQDARYYAAISLLFMAAIYYALTQRPMGLLACMGLLPYIQPIGPAYALAAWLIGWRSGMPFKKMILIGALAGVAWMPKMAEALGVFAEKRSDFWLQHFGALYVLEQTAQSFSVNTLNVWGAVALVLLIAFMLVRGIGEKQSIPWIAFVAPTAILLIVSIDKPVYFYRPEQPAALALCLLAGVTLAPSQSWQSKIMPALAGALLLIMVTNYSAETRGGYIDQGAEVVSRNWHNGDRIMYATFTVALPFQVYLPDRESCVIPDNGLDEIPSGLPGLDYCPEVSDAGTWLVWPRAPQMEPGLTQQLIDTTEGMMPAWRSDAAWQIAPVEIYYLVATP